MQRTAHEIEERGIVTAGRTAAIDQVQRPGLGTRRIIGRDQLVLRHQVKNQIATRQCAIGMFAWIVIGGAAYFSHQQGNLMQLQLTQRLAKIKFTGQAKAMNRTIAVLTTGRQDWGILRSVCVAIDAEPSLRLALGAGGMHLSARHGHSIDGPLFGRMRTRFDRDSAVRDTMFRGRFRSESSRKVA